MRQFDPSATYRTHKRRITVSPGQVNLQKVEFIAFGKLAGADNRVRKS